MVMYKNLNGVQVQLTQEEEQAILAQRAAMQPFLEASDTYEAWKAECPSHDELSRILSRIVFSLARSEVPDEVVLASLGTYISHLDAEPPLPEAP